MTELELDEVTVRYPSGPVVGPISLTVTRGEMLSLLGPSGCGKSTLLRTVAGFIKPTAGAVRLSGRDITREAPHRRRAAMVFQNLALFPHLTVAENIAFGPRRHREPHTEIRRRVERLISLVQLDGLSERRPADLSGGQRQRVALARALAVEPTVVLLDEPFSSLDAELRESTRAELRVLQQGIGFTAILVTHDRSEALAISDRVAVMRMGQIEQVGTPREVYRRPATDFVASFVGPVNRVPGGLVRPEDIRITSPNEPGTHSAVIETVAFLGGTIELRVRKADGQSLHVLAVSSNRLRASAGETIGVAWSEEDLITAENLSGEPAKSTQHVS